ncbi:ATP-binding cassette, subfamily B, bacterial [Enterococcus sp. DIV2402]|uniref:ATP-binding cassette, subfamily B, bacterial n=1 Tax=Candidatus Enterococcus lowellii TaxID=2230877 RepID=A0ABZ2SQL7_9ENTE|nr:ATP-binding cassette domain-containing protein [Enterococcus sp. DIV2402]MBO0463808.1 ATP-binding cassette domain-containing protein [Enterococcus sp. DIV2402]
MFAIMDSCLDRMEELFSVTVLEDAGQNALNSFDEKQPEVVFEQVSFGYDKSLVLEDVNFELLPSTMTALVGPSDSGKSTIANLLARFWDIQSGAIRIRGTQIKDLSLNELMKSISMVFQQTYLFEDSIYNNIKMGKMDATEEEIFTAAKKARCFDFIQNLPQGLIRSLVRVVKVFLGDSTNVFLSQFLKDAPIVILDETTASVDANNEYYIQLNWLKIRSCLSLHIA